MASWAPTGNFILIGGERAQHEEQWLPDSVQKPIVKGLVQSGVYLDMYATTLDGKTWYKLDDQGFGFVGVGFTPDGKNAIWNRLVDRDNWIKYPKFGKWRMLIAQYVEENGIPSLRNERDITPEGAVFIEGGGFHPNGEDMLITADMDIQAARGNNEGMDQYVLNIRTGKWVNLTNSPTVWDEHGVYSPRGTKVLFMSSLPYKDDPKASQTLSLKTEYFIMNPDGSNLQQLTHFNAPGHPESAKPGERVVAAVGSWRDDGTEIDLWPLVSLNYESWKIVFQGACG